MYSEQHPFELDCTAAPSLGISYGLDRLSIRPLTFEDISDIGESDTTGDELPYVLAINNCVTNLQNCFLDVADFYLVAAIVRLISLPEMPITMKWVCAERHAKLRIGETPKSQELQELLTAKSFTLGDSGLWEKFAVSEKEFSDLNNMLEAYPDATKEGSWYTCGTHNTFDLTPEHLIKHVRQFPKETSLHDLEQGFRFPNSLDIPEYKKFLRNPKLAKIVRVCMWMDDSYGDTLEKKLNYLKTSATQTSMHIIQQALKYEAMYKAGLSKVVVSGGCKLCGSATHTAVVSVSPKMFFTQ